MSLPSIGRILDTSGSSRETRRVLPCLAIAAVAELADLLAVTGHSPMGGGFLGRAVAALAVWNLAIVMVPSLRPELRASRAVLAAFDTPARRALLGLAILGFVTVLVLVTGAGIAGSSASWPLRGPGESTAYVRGVLISVLIAPVVEEFIYRELVFRSLRHALGFASAAWISALLFALAHPLAGGVPRFIYLAGAGLLLAWARERSGSLIAPIVLHGGANAGVRILHACMAVFSG